MTIPPTYRADLSTANERNDPCACGAPARVKIGGPALCGACATEIKRQEWIRRIIAGMVRRGLNHVAS